MKPKLAIVGTPEEAVSKLREGFDMTLLPVENGGLKVAELRAHVSDFNLFHTRLVLATGLEVRCDNSAAVPTVLYFEHKYEEPYAAAVERVINGLRKGLDVTDLRN